MVFAQTVGAQTYDYEIESFSSEIEIQEAGKIIITEEIKVNFHTARHGIYRDMPYRYFDDETTYYTDVDVIAISRGQVSEKYKVTRNDANLRIRIGDPDHYIQGPQTYVIEYSVLGALTTDGNYDQLYWNVTGNNWEVPINQVDARVILPTNITTANCFVGAYESTANCDEVIVTDDRVVFNQGLIDPSSGLTIQTSWPTGITAIVHPFDWFNLIRKLFFLLPIITILLSGWYWYKKWDKHGRDPQISETIVVQYTPPSGLTPIQAGLLLDDTIQEKEIAGQIVELARQGYLTITEMKGDVLQLWSKDYQLARTTKPFTELSEHELLLLRSLFKFGESLKISDLKNKFHQDLKSIKQQVNQDSVDQGLYNRNPAKAKNLTLVIVMLVIAQVIWYLLSIPITNYLGSTSSVLLLVAVLGPVLVAVIFLQLMPQRTEFGTKQLEHLLGYKEFIETAEKHRAKFYEDNNLVFQVMPYAIMFGLAKKFAESVKVMGLSPTSPEWFISPSGFEMSNFSSSMSNLTSTLSTNMASTPGNSGSGSGGFSGGGFGGGGGGSW